MLQLLGGVDPDLVLAGFLLTGLTMLSTASVSVLVSLHNTTTWNATFRTYLAMLAYFAFTLLCGGLILGNPLLALRRLQADDTHVVRLVFTYGAVHLFIAVGCVFWAIRDLRLAALGEPAAVTGIAPTIDPRSSRERPPIGDDPLLWKERNETGLAWWSGHELLDSCALLMTTTCISVFAGLATLALAARGTDISESIQNVAAFGATTIATFMLILVALNAAGRFSREVERQTLDSLLTLPDRDGILGSKWRASILFPVKFLWLVVGFWIIGLLSGGLHVPALPVVAFAWFVYAAFLASLGLFFSLWTGSTVRATILTMLTSGGGMIILWLGLDAVLEFSGVKVPGEWLLVTSSDCVALPPCTLWWFAFASMDLKASSWPILSFFSGVGVALYGAAAAVLWTMTKELFRARYGAGHGPKPPL
jgi:hypothetical protein